MAITGLGDYPLQSRWLKNKTKGNVKCLYKDVSFTNKGSTTVSYILINNWFFDSSIPVVGSKVFRKTLSTIGTRIGSRQLQGG